MKNKILLILVMVGFLVTGCAQVYSTSHNVIDLNNDDNKMKQQQDETKLNFAHLIAQYYDSISFTFIEKDIKVYIQLKQNVGITNIEINSDKESELNINIEYKDIVYIVNNYDTMSNFDKLKFLSSLDIDEDNVEKLSGIAMNVWSDNK